MEMQIKRKRKKSKSTIIFIIFLTLFFFGGFILIIYPFLTSIPSYIEKNSKIASWQSLKEKLISVSQENQKSATTIYADSEKTTEISSTDILNPANTNEQESQQQNSENQQQDLTSTTLSKNITNTENNKNVKVTAENIFPAKITIPKINAEWIVNEGADVATLKKGPGHIPETPLPGEIGRCTISGHRTTYGAPFNRIDELKKDDLIYLEALNGNKYIYKVKSFQVIKPDFVEILNGTDKKELLLSTCFPEYSAKERFVVIAELVMIFPFNLNLR
ncbi:MAG: class E sortase [Cyanobacteria bacterium]|nr:class E sortase [Cyanobacteriota bacterium]